MSKLDVNLVAPAELIGGRVNFKVRPDGGLEVLLDETEMEPSVAPALADAGVDAITELMMIEHHPKLVVRYHLERTIPGGRLVAYEISPYQIDMYVLSGLMPYSLSQELAGHSTYVLRRYL